MSRLIRSLVVGLVLLAVALPTCAQQSPGGRPVPSTEQTDTLSARKARGTERPEEWQTPSFSFKEDEGTLSVASSSVDVHIAAVIADVTVQKTYVYTGVQSLRNTVYRIELPPEGRLHKVAVHVGDRTLRAVPRKAEEETISVIEENEQSEFRMQVRNLFPGDTVRVRVHYTQSLTPKDGVYNLFVPGGEKPGAFEAVLSAGVPIRDVAVPPHSDHVRVERPDPTTARVTTREKEISKLILNLRYRLGGSSISSGLLLYEGTKENFFLATMHPPVHMPAEEGPPREYLFVVDPSVGGRERRFDPPDTTTVSRLIHRVMAPLGPRNHFNVIPFNVTADSGAWAHRSQPATQENVRAALHFLQRQDSSSSSGGAGGEKNRPVFTLADAAREAAALPKLEAHSRSVVVITDRMPRGVNRERVRIIFEDFEDAGVVAVGLDEDLWAAGFSYYSSIVRLGTAGHTDPFVMDTWSEDVEATSRRLRRSFSPVLSEMDVSFEGFEAYDVLPASPPSLLAGRPVVLVGKWRGSPSGTVTLRGRHGERLVEHTLTVNAAAPDSVHAGLPRLWARRRANTLLVREQRSTSGEAAETTHSRETEAALIRLGLQYDLLTPHTPLVAFNDIQSSADRQHGVGDIGGKVWTPPADRPPSVSPFDSPACCPSGRPLQVFDIPYTPDQLKTVDPLVVKPEAHPPFADPGQQHMLTSTRGSTDGERVQLPNGSFLLGLTAEDSLNVQDAGRQRVRLSASFYIDRHEVTNTEYRSYLDTLSSEDRNRRRPDSTVWTDVPADVSWHTYFHDDAWSDHPVVSVTWGDAAAYCAANGMRLPTEAEWEYAARGGRVGGVYPWPGFSPRDDRGEFRGNFAPSDTSRAADGYAFTAPAGSYPSSSWGLYDVAGNVAEWVRDAYAPDYSVHEPKVDSWRDSLDPVEDPVYEDSTAARRVVRGGSWASSAFEIGVGVRDARKKDEPSARIGFRCAADVRAFEGEQGRSDSPSSGPKPTSPATSQPDGPPKPERLHREL